MFFAEFQNYITLTSVVLIAYELQRFTSEGSCLSSRDVIMRPSKNLFKMCTVKVTCSHVISYFYSNKANHANLYQQKISEGDPEDV